MCKTERERGAGGGGGETHTGKNERQKEKRERERDKKVRERERERDSERKNDSERERERVREGERARKNKNKQTNKQKHVRHILCCKMYKTLHGMKHHTQSQSTFSFYLIKPYQPFNQTRTSTTHNETNFSPSLSIYSHISHSSQSYGQQ